MWPFRTGKKKDGPRRDGIGEPDGGSTRMESKMRRHTFSGGNHANMMKPRRPSAGSAWGPNDEGRRYSAPKVPASDVNEERKRALEEHNLPKDGKRENRRGFGYKVESSDSVESSTSDAGLRQTLPARRPSSYHEKLGKHEKGNISSYAKEVDELREQLGRTIPLKAQTELSDGEVVQEDEVYRIDRGGVGSSAPSTINQTTRTLKSTEKVDKGSRERDKTRTEKSCQRDSPPKGEKGDEDIKAECLQGDSLSEFNDADGKAKRVIDTYMVFETRFDVDSRFVVTDAVGQGAYGVVCAALDKQTEEMVAIKKICNTFEHNMFCKRTLREIKLLRLLRHENIIGVRQILRPINPANFEDIYVISDLMETDLSCIIKSPQTLSDEHVQFFLYQLLRAVKYIHTSNVIHRDLKPRNLLVNSNCDLKVCDFGLARVDFSELNWKTVAMTDYIATRWYRAPEVMLKWSKYTKAIDMWSVGCILAELINRKPIFPGTDTEHQVILINDLLGPFDADFVSQMRNVKAKEFLKQLPRPANDNLSSLFRDANPAAVDLLHKLLEVNPTKRITVEQALEHPYLEALHEADDEPSGNPVARESFEFEYQFLHTNELRREILKEILHHHSKD